jgi:ribosomal protein S18 acetylase RimI-like enzyme
MPGTAIQLLHPLDAGAFLRLAREFLHADEIENNVMLGRVEEAAAHPERAPAGDYYAVATVGGAVAGAALRAANRPGRPVVLSRMPAECAAAMAVDLAREEPPLPAASGIRPTIDAFAAAYCQATDAGARVVKELRMYRLDAVAGDWPAPGRFRAAAPDELDAVCLWAAKFLMELGLGAMREEETATFRRMIAETRVFVWDDGGAVAMAAWIPATPQTGRLEWVYTPPALRCRGYATACVAALSHHLLAAGRIAMLGANVANPTSNSIYRKIGYRPVCDSAEYRFDFPGAH